jgi:hypothetical protein
MRAGFWVGLALGGAIAGGVAIAAFFGSWPPMPTASTDFHLDCAGRRTTTQSLVPTEEDVRFVLRARPGAEEPTVEFVQSLSGGPLGVPYLIGLCENYECEREFSDAKIFLQYGEPLGDAFYHLEVSRLTGQYTASQRIRDQLLIEESGTCTRIDRPQF